MTSEEPLENIGGLGNVVAFFHSNLSAGVQCISPFEYTSLRTKAIGFFHIGDNRDDPDVEWEKNDCGPVGPYKCVKGMPSSALLGQLLDDIVLLRGQNECCMTNPQAKMRIRHYWGMRKGIVLVKRYWATVF